MLYLREAETNQCLAYDPRLVDILTTLEQGYRDYVAGTIVTPPGERIRLTYPPKTRRQDWTHDMRMLPAIMPGLGMAGLHVATTAPVRQGPGFGSHAFLWDFDTLRLVAVIEDRRMHRVRAGSPSGVATRWLARPDCRVAGCIGSGEIMEQAITAVCGARPIEAVKVFSPARDHRMRFATMMTERLGLPFEAVDSAREAVRGADVVQIVTNSHFEPVIDGAWLEPGQHINSIAPGELDETTILRSSLFVGTRERTLHDNPPRQPLMGMLERGLITTDFILAEMGEVITGQHPGRTRADEITLFLSPGVGFYDVAIATWVYRTAREHGIGLELPD